MLNGRGRYLEKLTETSLVRERENFVGVSYRVHKKY